MWCCNEYRMWWYNDEYKIWCYNGDEDGVIMLNTEDSIVVERIEYINRRIYSIVWFFHTAGLIAQVLTVITAVTGI